MHAQHVPSLRRVGTDCCIHCSPHDSERAGMSVETQKEHDRALDCQIDGEQEEGNPNEA